MPFEVKAELPELSWPSREDRNSLALRLHYLARAKPMEDERTIKAQHVAPGTWPLGHVGKAEVGCTKTSPLGA